MIYNLIRRAVVKFGWMFLKRKFVLRTALVGILAAVLGITAVGVAGYIATRDVPEG